MNDQAVKGLRELEERRDGFAYDYRMRCECGKTSTLTAAEFVAEKNNALMDCEHCGEQIYFGLAVAALRDTDDPALRDECVPRLAWYHTSTAADWPAPDYAARFDSDLDEDLFFGPSRESYLVEQTSKALHVGTYEAAIENMLRRMHDQLDGASQFYLYRVALRIAPGRINEGYRDDAVAADIGVSELAEAGLDAVRYLNVYEAIGTLSLAVRPTAIAAVQRLQIPVPGLSVDTDADVVGAAAEMLETVTRELADAEAAASLDPRVRRQMQFGLQPDPGGVAKRIRDLELEYYRRWTDLEDQLADAMLPNVSPMVRCDFNEAVSSERGRSGHAVADFVERYRQLGALLERADDVVAHLAEQQWRAIDPK